MRIYRRRYDGGLSGKSALIVFAPRTHRARAGNVVLLRDQYRGASLLGAGPRLVRLSTRVEVRPPRLEHREPRHDRHRNDLPVLGVQAVRLPTPGQGCQPRPRASLRTEITGIPPPYATR